MKVIIQTADNGFVLKVPDYSANKEALVEVFQDDAGQDTLDALKQLLYAVRDHLGYSGSKHDARRIFIDIRKGDEYCLENTQLEFNFKEEDSGE